jgi:hypothetical protein
VKTNASTDKSDALALTLNDITRAAVKGITILFTITFIITIVLEFASLADCVTTRTTYEREDRLSAPGSG